MPADGPGSVSVKLINNKNVNVNVFVYSLISP